MFGSIRNGSGAGGKRMSKAQEIISKVEEAAVIDSNKLAEDIYKAIKAAGVDIGNASILIIKRVLKKYNI